MNSKIFFLLVAPCLLNLSLSTTSQAATVTNSYVFIENNVDNEYFITPRTTDPRFRVPINIRVIQNLHSSV